MKKHTLPAQEQSLKWEVRFKRLCLKKNKKNEK